ncbi:hypothetical protein [Actinomadura parmotrematis]|uniref:Uncharacterized protein n=1 Tax=Actinomadura parmotrematis TaxID=2864039 RepID=A0ABS7FXD2_9ACTN|nr:hypothetical protein [Actinomadura parmotrematis]MBW8485072.1 hypothetical protein [Actinomadura parmotrematis]
MRLLSITAIGVAIVAAGMAAPANGEATAKGRVEAGPGLARPGERISLTAPACPDGARRHLASSAAFVADAQLSTGTGAGRGTAVLRSDARPGTYKITARCGTRATTGTVKVTNRRTWPAVLSSSLDPSATR